MLSGSSPYRTKIFLKKLGSGCRNLDEVLDLRQTGKASQSRRQRSFHMSVYIPSNFQSHSTNANIGECIGGIPAYIIEWYLELEGIFVLSRRKRVA